MPELLEIKQPLPCKDKQIQYPDLQRLFIANKISPAVMQAVLSSSPNPEKAELLKQMLSHIPIQNREEGDRILDGYPLNKMKNLSAMVTVVPAPLEVSQAVVNNNILTVLFGAYHSNGNGAYQVGQQLVTVSLASGGGTFQVMTNPFNPLVIPFPIYSLRFYQDIWPSNIYYLLTEFYYD